MYPSERNAAALNEGALEGVAGGNKPSSKSMAEKADNWIKQHLSADKDEEQL